MAGLLGPSVLDSQLNQARSCLEEDVKVVLDELVGGARQILGERFIGAWLQGSSATGGLGEYSDVDVAIGFEKGPY